MDGTFVHRKVAGVHAKSGAMLHESGEDTSLEHVESCGCLEFLEVTDDGICESLVRQSVSIKLGVKFEEPLGLLDDERVEHARGIGLHGAIHVVILDLALEGEIGEAPENSIGVVVADFVGEEFANLNLFLADSLCHCEDTVVGSIWRSEESDATIRVFRRVGGPFATHQRAAKLFKVGNDNRRFIGALIFALIVLVGIDVFRFGGRIWVASVTTVFVVDVLITHDAQVSGLDVASSIVGIEC